MTWDKLKECDVFIKKLMTASEQLAQRNHRFRNLHLYINLNMDLFAGRLIGDEVLTKIARKCEQEVKSNTLKAMAM